MNDVTGPLDVIANDTDGCMDARCVLLSPTIPAPLTNWTVLSA